MSYRDNRRRCLLNFGVDTAGDDEEVRKPIVVEVFKAGAPADKAGFDADFRSARVASSKFAFAIVAYTAAGIRREVGLDDVQRAIASVVADADAHAGLLHPVFTQGHAASRASSAKVPSCWFMKSRLGVESQATKISVQPSFVEISGNNGEAVTGAAFSIPAALVTSAKSAIAVVAIQRVAAIRSPRGPQ